MRVAPTGSKVHRVWKCPPSAILPQIDNEDDGHEPARRKGKLIHAYLERAHAIGQVAALAECDDEALLTLLRAIDLDALPVHLATEVAFAWNWRTNTARELGRNIDRQYGLGAAPIDWSCEIPCTLDLVGEQRLATGHRGYVGDYKSGHAKLPPPDRNGQLLLGALCARSVYGLDDCVVEMIHLHDSGDHHKVRRIVDGWDLDTFADELQAAMELVAHWEAEYAAGRGVNAHEGPHCDYCPAFRQCPAKVALVRSIPAELMAMGIRPGAGEEPALTLTPGAITVRNASEIWMTLERISDVVNLAKAEICGIAAMEPIPLSDGRVIGVVHTERRELDGRIAAEVLEERYGRAAVDEAVMLKVSMQALHRAVVRRKGEKEKIQTQAKDGVLDRVLAEIERRGGIGLNTTDNVKPHVPKKGLAR